MTVRYAIGHQEEVHAEYQAFYKKHPDEAADSLAMLYHIAAAGFGAIDPDFGLRRPYCFQSCGWGIFFESDGPVHGPCNVTILLVMDLDVLAIDPALLLAAERLHTAQ